MSLLVNSSKLFPIDIKYAEVKFRNGISGIVVIDNEEDEKKYKDSMKELKTQWQVPNWKEHTEIIRQSMIWDEFKGERMMDFGAYRSLCLESFLKAWDIVDDANKPVPCNKDSIAKLDHNIAHALQEAFVDRNIPTEQELKN